MLPIGHKTYASKVYLRFNGHPPLGVNATAHKKSTRALAPTAGFNGHPPLGVNATFITPRTRRSGTVCFNGHPPLGVNATNRRSAVRRGTRVLRFNGHPPLGVNATSGLTLYVVSAPSEFQRAPTLGGECYQPELMVAVNYYERFKGHPPLGVNATI